MNANKSNANDSEASFANNVATSIDVSTSNTSTTNNTDYLSSKWASSTLEALAPATARADLENQPLYSPTINSAVSTPGSITQLVPGAFPASAHLNTVLPQIDEQSKEDTTMLPNANTQYVKEVTASALVTARDYAMRTGETVSGYLPESIAAYLPSSTKTIPNENSAATESDSNEHPVPAPQIFSDGGNSAEIDPSMKGNTPRATVTDEAQTETMRKGLESIKVGNQVPKHHESANTKETDHVQTDRSTLNPTGASRDEDRMREGQSEAGADTDTSTRSLAGRGLYTPGRTSLFSGKWQDDGQSVVTSAHETTQDATAGESIPTSVSANRGPAHDVRTPVVSQIPDFHNTAKGSTGTDDVKAPTTHNEATQAKEQSHHRDQPTHRAMPVTDGREHPIALGPTPSSPQATTTVNPLVSAQRQSGGDSKPNSASTDWERVDSSRATPGHGAPPIPPKDNESAAVNARNSPPQVANVGVVAASAAAGAGMGGDLGGAGAGNAAGAPTGTTKSAHAHAHGAPPSGDGSHSNGTEGKKSGFFQKLKKEVRALSGKHHKDSAGNDVLKN